MFYIVKRLRAGSVGGAIHTFLELYELYTCAIMSILYYIIFNPAFGCHTPIKLIVLYGGTAFHPTYDSPTFPSSVPPGVEDVFVWLTETPAPSDFCL